MTVYVKSQTILYNRTIGLRYKVDKQTDDYASDKVMIFPLNLSPRKNSTHSQLMRFSLFSLSLPGLVYRALVFFSEIVKCVFVRLCTL